jgi:hypothetical protein
MDRTCPVSQSALSSNATKPRSPGKHQEERQERPGARKNIPCRRCTEGEISTSGGKSHGGTRAQPELWGHETKTVGEKNEEVERKRERKKIVRKGEGEEMGGRERDGGRRRQSGRRPKKGGRNRTAQICANRAIRPLPAVAERMYLSNSFRVLCHCNFCQWL